MGMIGEPTDGPKRGNGRFLMENLLGPSGFSVGEDPARRSKRG